MQDLSFEFRNASFVVGKHALSVMIYSFTNAYSLDPDSTSYKVDDDREIYECDSLLTNGGQTKAKGKALVVIKKELNRYSVGIAACIDNIFEEIRSVKLGINGLDDGKIINLIDARDREITDFGINFKYPEGWRDAGTPLVIFRNKKNYTYIKSIDNKVREKIFTFIKKDKHINAEAIFEEEATKMSNKIEVPLWVIGEETDLDRIYCEHITHVEKSYGLKSWDSRPDLPDWAKEISLVAAIHAQHWTGYIFNDYAKILEDIKYLATKIDPKHILVYIPGFEGRYYWKYGNYNPDERMGGEEGFRRLCNGAKELGVHLMPMFGINMAGVNHDNFVEWGQGSQMLTSSGNLRQGSVDWDGSRHYDHSTNRNLNPGAPKWQNRLSSQIISLANEYGFDAVFLDIAAVWQNDPNFNVYEGVKELIAKLHEGIPNLLVSGEGWYDGLMNCIPLIQSGHTDGKLHFHDQAYPKMFDEYCREFAHLCLGDPSRLSTGVHEQGTNPEWRIPLRKGLIPTVTIVDGTMEHALDKVNEIIDDAKEYAKRFLER